MTQHSASIFTYEEIQNQNKKKAEVLYLSNAIICMQALFTYVKIKF